MIEELPGSGGRLIAMKATGTVTDEDYRTVLIPRLEAAIQAHGKARFLFVLTDDFRGYQMGAVWDDAVFGLRHRADFERIAVVSGPGWIEWATRLGAFLVAGEVRTFREEREAWEWLNL